MNQSAPIVLSEAARLWAHLKDSSRGVAIEGQIFLVFPTGRREGPFPVNDEGVRIRTLEPGVYRLVGQVPGYTQQRAVSLTLEAGKETEAEVLLAPIETTPGE